MWDGFKLSFSATRSERARKRNNLLLEPIHLGTEPAGIGKEDEEEEGGGEEEGAVYGNNHQQQKFAKEKMGDK